MEFIIVTFGLLLSVFILIGLAVIALWAFTEVHKYIYREVRKDD